MDVIDSEIVRLLRDDARLSWRDLGAAVGLSANAAADRVRRLRRAGVITGFAALVDPAAGGRTLRALVGVHLAQGVDSDEFAAGVTRLEQVTEVLHLTGAPDYQLRVACVDTAELDALLRTLRLRHGVADTETTIILRSGPPRPESRRAILQRANGTNTGLPERAPAAGRRVARRDPPRRRHQRSRPPS
jgi:Lrp/AsnC family leucine-responsive transcriptional regulator